MNVRDELEKGSDLKMSADIEANLPLYTDLI